MILRTEFRCCSSTSQHSMVNATLISFLLPRHPHPIPVSNPTTSLYDHCHSASPSHHLYLLKSLSTHPVGLLPVYLCVPRIHCPPSRRNPLSILSTASPQPVKSSWWGPDVSHLIPNVQAAFLLLQLTKLAAAEGTMLAPTWRPVGSSHLLKSDAFCVAPLRPLYYLLTLVLEYTALWVVLL